MVTRTTPITARSISRRDLLSSAAVAAAGLTSLSALVPGSVAGSVSQARPRPAAEFDARVPTAWFDLLLRSIRATAGFTPPVASRAIGCAGIGLYESLVPGMPGYVSVAGLLSDMPPIPAAGRNTAYHWPSVANASLAAMARSLFPTAPASIRTEIDSLEASFADGVPIGIAARSIDRGHMVARAIDAWARNDGGHEGYLRNFPSDYTPPSSPGLWVPTPPAFQRALQPYWGRNRPMASGRGGTCDPGAPPAFSTDEGSAFFAQAVEVFEAVDDLTSEQEAIALFWADDPGRTATPAGHSVSILTQLLRLEDRSLADAAEAYARLGIALCDAFIACWRAKYEHNLIRPISYIRAQIDPGWGDPLPVVTPPFPEYPSGHSVQSGAAAAVLTSLFGTVAFTDRTHEGLGLPSRAFTSFDAFAEEAAISRLYGGIHFRSAIEDGLAQGHCIGSTVSALPLLA